MFNKSIAYRLSLFISIAVIVVFLAFISANFLFNRKLLRENTEIKAIGLNYEINSLVNRNIISTKEVAQNIAGQIIYYSQNNDADILLTEVMKKYELLNAIHVQIDSAISLPDNNYYIFRNNGRFLFEKGGTPIYNCQQAKNIIENLQDRTIASWTDAYRCREKENVVVSFTAPIMHQANGGELLPVGIVVCELSLTELNESLNQLKIGEKGYAFLINRKGDYITHPIEEWILKQNIYSLPSKVLDIEKFNVAEFLTNGEAGSTIGYPEFLNYEKQWVYFSPVNEKEWFLIIVIPYRELFTDLYIITFQMALFALLGIITIFFIIYFITKKLIKPLSIVTSRLNELKSDSDDSVSTLNEVKQVSDTLEYLKAWFEQYRISREQEELKSLRHKQDLVQASEIQQSLIKTTFPAFPERKEIDLYAIYKPAGVVSGDLFDYIFIDDDNLLLTIGDVSGAGIPAAIFMSVAQTIIKNNAVCKRAKNIVRKSNVELCTSNRHLYFLTLFLGVLNVKTGVLNFCNAAHYYPLILKQGGKVTELKLSHGLPLGLYPNKDYKDAKMILDPGDIIVLYTDGVTEVHNVQGKQFGTDRLKEGLKKMAGLSPEEIVKELNNQLETFQGEQQQHDDICLLVIKYMP